MSIRKAAVSARLAVFVALFACLSLAGQDFVKQVSPQELAMKDNPAAPGTHAMILEWIIDANDITSISSEYYRIKIFTDEGKKQADIEIPYNRQSFNVSDIKARTIQPDGTIVPFQGKIFEKIVVKGRNYEIRAKTFTMPDVRPGSIIEYRYRTSWDTRSYLNTTWQLQKKMYIAKAKLNLKPFLGGGAYATYISMLAPGMKQPDSKGDSFTMYLENVPAFEDEEFSLPEAQTIPRIDFFYRSDNAKNPDEYWTKVGKESHGIIEDFIGKRGGIRNAAATIVNPADDNDTKLKKIYARVQQIRNLSYESSKTEKEQKRITPKDNNHVEDVWKNGYGYRREITRLFVALARAAGVEASIALISQRDAQLFHKLMLDARQFDGEVAVAKGNNGDIVLDPSTPYCPFGMLSWENTGVDALRLDKEGGVFFKTPQPLSTQAIMKRVAELKLDEEGSLTGKVVMEYSGQEALRLRLNAMETDEVEQKKDYEERLENRLPSGSKVTLTKVENAADGEQPLHLEYDVTIPPVTSSVGSRTLLPMLVFQARSGNPFEFAKRVRPVYFRYPSQEIEQVRITLPDGSKVEGMPKSAVVQKEFGYYDTQWATSGNVVNVVRRRSLDGFVFHQNRYPELREFYSQINSNDRENVVLRMGQ